MPDEKSVDVVVAPGGLGDPRAPPAILQATAPPSPSADAKVVDYTSSASVVPVAQGMHVKSLLFRDLCYAVPVPNPAKAAKDAAPDTPKTIMRDLLKNVNGEILAGQVVAIMGGSGAFLAYPGGGGCRGPSHAPLAPAAVPHFRR
jgi:hypothetical protein